MISIRKVDDKLCEICGKRVNYEVKDVYEIYVYNTVIESVIGKDFINAHFDCFIRFLLEKISSLLSKLSSYQIALSKRIEADKIADKIIAELEAKRSVNVTKDMLIYQEGDFFLKVTDYKKGYWAETPLKVTELRAFIKFLQTIESGGRK